MADTRLMFCVYVGMAALLAGCSRSGEGPEAVSLGQTGLESTITAESPAAAREELPEADPPTIPLAHQTILDALQKTRPVHFKNADLVDCLKDLSTSLGLQVTLHEELLKAMHGERRVTLGPTSEISHQTAIMVTLRSVGYYNTGLMFEDGQVTIVPGEHPAASLRTIDLRGRADLTLARRDQLIRQSVASVEPQSWSNESATWIRPGESVFDVDVYQTSEVHMQLSKMLQITQHQAIVDHDVQKLQQFPGLLAKGEKPVDKVAVVERLRKKYPYESLIERLSYETSARRTAPKLSDSAAKRLAAKDKQFSEATAKGMHYRAMRAESLRMLHEEEVKTFVGKPGAGLARMPVPGPSYLPQSERRHLPLADADMLQPDFDVAVTLPAKQTDAANRRIYLPSIESMQHYHFNSENTFASAPSLGYIKSRNQVAGFQPHGLSFIQRLSTFKRRPWYTRAKELWAVHRMELVSLLKHETPGVYVSRNVPRMEDLRDGEVRPLNDFETPSLKKLVDAAPAIVFIILAALAAFCCAANSAACVFTVKSS